MKEDQIKRVVEAVSATEAGVSFLRWLADTCGFAKADLVVHSGSVDAVATALNVERRRVYLDVRRFVPAEALKRIEFAEVEEKKEEKI